jgi:hypothetical protein
MSDITKKIKAIENIEELNEMIASLEFIKQGLTSNISQLEDDLKSKLEVASLEIEAKKLILVKLEEQIKNTQSKNEELISIYKELTSEINKEKEVSKERDKLIVKKEVELQAKELELSTISMNCFEKRQELIDKEKDLAFKEREIINKETSLKTKEENIFKKENEILLEGEKNDKKVIELEKLSNESSKREIFLSSKEKSLKDEEEAFRVSKLQSFNLSKQNEQDLETIKEKEKDIFTKERKMKLDEAEIERVKESWAKKEANLILREEEVKYREKQVAIKEKSLQ